MTAIEDRHAWFRLDQLAPLMVSEHDHVTYRLAQYLAPQAQE